MYKFIDIKGRGNETTRLSGDTVKATLKGKFVSINFPITKTEAGINP